MLQRGSRDRGIVSAYERGLGKVAEPLAFDRQYYTDWLAALMHLIEGNADYEGGQTFDPEQNARLGRLINNLNPSVFTQDN